MALHRTNERDSQVIDYENPANNMYGCPDCPKCGSKFRAAWRRPYGPNSSGGLRIECDDCGHLEWAAPRTSSPPISNTGSST